MNFGGNTVQLFTAIITVMHGSEMVRSTEAALGTVPNLCDLAQSCLSWTSVECQG